MQRIILYCILFSFISCSKKHEPLNGIVNVSGTVNDIISNAPVSNCIVYLVIVRLQPDGLGGTSPEITDQIVAKDTTDGSGNYSLTYNATGQYELYVKAKSINPLYGEPAAVDHHDNWIRNIGDHIDNFRCYRSAYARVSVINEPPIDTPLWLIMEAGNRIVLPNFYKDTLVFLKLSGNPAASTGIVFEEHNQYHDYFFVTAGPWDTIPLQFKY